MFFEGAEKKAEIQIDLNYISLLNDLNDEFWQALVSCCNAANLITDKDRVVMEKPIGHCPLKRRT